MESLSETASLGRALHVVGRTTPQQRRLAHGGISAVGRTGRRWRTVCRMSKAAGVCWHGTSRRAVLVLLYQGTDSFFQGLSIEIQRVILSPLDVCLVRTQQEHNSRVAAHYYCAYDSTVE